MKINQNKLPVKYALNVYKEMKEFPTHIDLVYMLLSNLSDREEIEKSFTPSQVWQYMKDGVGTINELQGFLDYVSDPVDCPGAFLQKLEMTQGRKPEWQYKVLDNPWA
jgi:hypothetical protein